MISVSVTGACGTEGFEPTASVLGTFNMLESLRSKGEKKFIFASSGAPLDEVDPPL